jgi:drug/metabolite transporter (DMT)-like permease
VGVLSSVLSGAAVATIREVRRTDGSWEIFAAFCLGGALISGVPAAVGWKAPSPSEWVALVTVGVVSVVAQLMMTYALRFVRAAIAGVVAQLTPVAAMAMGAVFFRESMAGLSALGALITLVGASWGAYLATSPEPVAMNEP